MGLGVAEVRDIVPRLQHGAASHADGPSVLDALHAGADAAHSAGVQVPEQAVRLPLLMCPHADDA